MPNFNDVYLDNYQVLDYGLICKNNPEWGLVSVASDPDAHLSHLFCHFSCHSDMFTKYGTLGSFLCWVMCCAQSVAANIVKTIILIIHARPSCKIGITWIFCHVKSELWTLFPLSFYFDFRSNSFFFIHFANTTWSFCHVKLAIEMYCWFSMGNIFRELYFRYYMIFFNWKCQYYMGSDSCKIGIIWKQFM